MLSGSTGWERWTALGHTDNFRVLLPVWTVRCDALWIMKKLIVPKFSTEAEEAEWWDNHMDVVEDNLLEAIQEGTAARGTAQRVLQQARELKSVTIRMAGDDVNRAERLSAKKGLSSEAYLRTLLHEALEREEEGDSTRNES
jgi:predicted DNA binding CopG/RHH family protein